MLWEGRIQRDEKHGKAMKDKKSNADNAHPYFLVLITRKLWRPDVEPNSALKFTCQEELNTNKI